MPLSLIWKKNVFTWLPWEPNEMSQRQVRGRRKLAVSERASWTDLQELPWNSDNFARTLELLVQVGFLSKWVKTRHRSQGFSCTEKEGNQPYYSKTSGILSPLEFRTTSDIMKNSVALAKVVWHRKSACKSVWILFVKSGVEIKDHVGILPLG